MSVWGLVHACFEKLREGLERNQGLGPLRLSPLEPSSRGPKNWVAVKELQLSYHKWVIMENQMENKMDNEMETGGI